MDNDNRKKLKQFWQKRLLFGLGTVGFLGLGWATIGLMRSTYDELQIAEGRNVPERFYQGQIAALSSAPCDAITTLGRLKDERAIAVLGDLLQNDENRTKYCRTVPAGYPEQPGYPKNQYSSVYTAAARALGESKQPEAVEYLKNALAKNAKSTVAIPQRGATRI